MKGYVYRIYDENSLVYVGVTKDMRSRMASHFTREDSDTSRQIPVDKIKTITRVEYTETATFSNARLLEVYLITKYKPIYNKDCVEDDELTYKWDISRLIWKEYPIYNHGENPNHSIRIKDKWGKILYEIPYVKAVYEPLQRSLGITYDLSQIRYCMEVTDNGYRIVRYKPEDVECRVQRQA